MMEKVNFGPFCLDLSSNRLLREGREIKLRRQAYEALRTLALHGGRYVGYDELIADAWRGTVVSRHTVDVTIGEVRKTLQDYAGWIVHRPKGGYCLDVPKSDHLVRRGWHFWNLRTRESFERALECFEQAGLDCPSDHRAFEGQSACYLMLASFGMRAGRDIYPRHHAAHRQAVALVGDTAELRCSRGYGLHLFERNFEAAEAEYHEALRERPTLASAWVRMALLNVTRGRLDEALECVGRAYAADPLLPTMAATEVSVRLWRREFDLAVQLGAKAVELHPYLLLNRWFYGQALEHTGRLEDALTQYRLGTVIAQGLPWMRAVEGACLVQMGRVDEAHAILADLELHRDTDYVDPYGFALLKDALGDRDGAFGELERAVDEWCAALYTLNVDPMLDSLRTDPRYRRVMDRYLAGATLSVGSF